MHSTIHILKKSQNQFHYCHSVQVHTCKNDFTTHNASEFQFFWKADRMLTWVEEHSRNFFALLKLKKRSKKATVKELTNFKGVAQSLYFHQIFSSLEQNGIINMTYQHSSHSEFRCLVKYLEYIRLVLIYFSKSQPLKLSRINLLVPATLLLGHIVAEKLWLG